MMKECPNLEICPMFKLFKLESTKRYFITTYCQGDFESCARKKVKDRGLPVPETLLPDGEHLKLK